MTVAGRRTLLRLRWSWRDLRARWLQVAAIALIIGIGSGTYSGLTSVSSWRRTSYDASYRALDMYDLHIEFADGSSDTYRTLDGVRQPRPFVQLLRAVA